MPLLQRLCNLLGGVQQPPLLSFMIGRLNKAPSLPTVYSAKVKIVIKELFAITSCAISCFEISRDFVVRMMTRQNRKLNETYLKLMFDWDSAESSVAQEVTPIPSRGINTHPYFLC